jgi:hypothetical protein
LLIIVDKASHLGNSPSRPDPKVFMLATGEGYELREAMRGYDADFDRKKCQIDVQNTHLWDINY